MDPDKIPFYLKHLSKNVENRVSDALKERREKQRRDDEDGAQPRGTGAGLTGNPSRRTGSEYMEFEPDWDELDRKADLVIAGYAVVSAAWNILPPPLDVMGVTATFAKMATELSGIYQVIVSSKRARQLGWAIATTTASVLGVAYAGSRLVKLIPGAGWLMSFLLQAPVVGAVAWAAGEVLKDYFKQARQGREPSIRSLQESFAKTLHIKLKKANIENAAAPSTNGNGAGAASAAPAAAAPVTVSDAVEKIASLHELMRAGAITPEEFEAKKAELLKQI
jgi:Uncharacterized protein/domain associated with GTPases